MKKGDLSKFVEDAVRWCILQRTIQDIRERNAGADPNEIQRIVDEAVSEVRGEHRINQQSSTPAVAFWLVDRNTASTGLGWLYSSL